MEPFQDYLDQARWHSQFNRTLMKQKLELQRFTVYILLCQLEHN